MTLITRAAAEAYKLFKIYDIDNNFLKSTIIVHDKTVFETEDEAYTILNYFADHNLELDPNEERNKNILRLAMVYNVNFPVSYTMTAPYTHSYCVSQHRSPYIEESYCEPVTDDDWYNGLPNTLYTYLIKNQPTFSYEDLLEHIKTVYQDETYIVQMFPQNYSSQLTYNEMLQKLKRALVRNELVTNNSDIAIQNNFNQIRDELLGE
jgi:hypothetical protein